MVKIAHIPEPPQRFINREQLEQIKIRSGRLPPGEYVNLGNNLYARLLDEKYRPTDNMVLISTIEYPGTLDFFLNMKQDIENLINHVENADKENDILLEKIKELEKP